MGKCFVLRQLRYLTGIFFGLGLGAYCQGCMLRLQPTCFAQSIIENIICLTEKKGRNGLCGKLWGSGFFD